MSWIERATATSDLRPEIYFLTQTQLYIGDPNRWEDFEKPEFNLPMEYPDAEFTSRYPELKGEQTNWVPLDYAYETKEKLAAHYRNVIDILLQHRGKKAVIEAEFWMRLALRSDEQKIAISFPWYDTLKDFRRLLSFVAEPKSAFWDTDQGWQVDGIYHADNFYFRESDPDDTIGSTDVGHPNDLVLSAPATPFQARCKAVEDRAQELIAYLSDVLGADAWTNHGVKISAFGTKNWRPRNQRKKWFGLF